MTEEEILAYIDSTMAEAVKTVIQNMSPSYINITEIIQKLDFKIDLSQRTLWVTDNSTGYQKLFIIEGNTSNPYSYPSTSTTFTVPF